MGFSHETWFVIPDKYFTEGQFAKTMDTLRHLPNSRISAYDPPDGDAPLFSTTFFPSPVIDGIDTYGFSAISNPHEEEEDLFSSSLPFGVLALYTEGKQFYESELLTEAYIELLCKIFVGMGAVYASGGSEYDFEEACSLATLVETTGGLHIFSEEMVDAIGEDIILGSGFSTVLEGVTIIRTDENEIYGGDFGRLSEVLAKVGEILCVDHEGQSEEKTPVQTQVDKDRGQEVTRENYGELRYSPYAPFTLLYCRDSTDMRTASAGFFHDLMAFDASEELPEDELWLRPDKLDQLADRLAYGEKIITRFKRSYTVPPTHLHSARVEMAALAGIPGQPSCGPIYEREGAISLFLGSSWSNLDGLHGVEGVTLMLQVLQLISKHFRPIYGMGVGAFSIFVDSANQQVIPESRIWPVNVFDLDALGHEFEGRLREFYLDNADRWMLADLHGRTVVLCAGDPKSIDPVQYEEATTSILGDIQDLSGHITAHLLGPDPGKGGGSL
jgi:hypothetical protein